MIRPGRRPELTAPVPPMAVGVIFAVFGAPSRCRRVLSIHMYSRNNVHLSGRSVMPGPSCSRDDDRRYRYRRSPGYTRLFESFVRFSGYSGAGHSRRGWLAGRTWGNSRTTWHSGPTRSWDNFFNRVRAGAGAGHGAGAFCPGTGKHCENQQSRKHQAA